jgi:hypothetical protein
MLLSSSYSNKIYFPQLFELSIPAIFGMYIIPFIMAVTLFSFVLKKIVLILLIHCRLKDLQYI